METFREDAGVCSTSKKHQHLLKGGIKFTLDMTRVQLLAQLPNMHLRFADWAWAAIQ